jgi:pyruvate-formate lyase-activating enzyme
MTDPLVELKIAILTYGIRLSDQALETLKSAKYSSAASTDYATTRGIPLRLGDHVYVNAPYLEHFTLNSDYVLHVQDSIFFLTGPRIDDRVNVDVFRNPAYYGTRTSLGTPMESIINTHTDRARVNPILGCAMRCDYCDAPFISKYRLNRIPDMVEAISIAATDPIKPARHVLVSGGTPAPKDESYMDDVYQTLARESTIQVDVMLAPRAELDYPFRLAEWGVGDLFVNLEGINLEVSRRQAYQKYKIGIEHYLRFIAAAVNAFGRGRVMSLVLVGLESMDDTLRAVGELTSRGCIPVLSPFRAALHTPLAHHPQPLPGFLKEALERAEAIASQHGMTLGPKCAACNHNTLTPARTSYFN